MLRVAVALTTEGSDVRLHPSQQQLLIQQPLIAAVRLVPQRRVLLVKVGRSKEAERSETEVACDNNDA